MTLSIRKMINSIIDLFCEPKKIYPIRVLFITKSKTNYGTTTASTLSTGLFNSAKQVCDSLNEIKGGIFCSKIVSVIDNNCIDREVTEFKPDIVIVEALWVVPSKFDELRRIHTKVKWVIRIHSNTPFMASEGVAFEWIAAYLTKPNVYVAANNERMISDLQIVFPRCSEKVIYLPNLYNIEKYPLIKPDMHLTSLHVGCFGATRILKNTLLQAIASIAYSEETGQTLVFHINSERVEGWGSDNILKNLRALFATRPEHYLIEHDWLPQDEFMSLLKTMDVVLQVSLSETFNLVAANAIEQGIPVVASEQINWISKNSQVQDPTSAKSILATLRRTLNWRKSVVLDSFDNLRNLLQRGGKIWAIGLSNLL